MDERFKDGFIMGLATGFASVSLTICAIIVVFIIL